MSDEEYAEGMGDLRDMLKAADSTSGRARAFYLKEAYLQLDYLRGVVVADGVTEWLPIDFREAKPGDEYRLKGSSECNWSPVRAAYVPDKSFELAWSKYEFRRRRHGSGGQ